METRRGPAGQEVNGKDAAAKAAPEYLLSAHEVLKRWQVVAESGLSNNEARQRGTQYGRNSIPRRKPVLLWRVLNDRRKDPLALFMLAAVALSTLAGQVGDAILLGLAILLDFCLGLAQMWRTERTMARLGQHWELKATVLRNGHWQQTAAAKLVPGDVVELRAGERVPADGRIIASRGFRVQETSLSGEAEDAVKNPAALQSRTALANRNNMVFFGTTATSGNAQIVVTATGTRTEFGKIAQMLKAESSPASPLRRALQKKSVRVAVIAGVLVAIVFGANIAAGGALKESARTAATLIVSIIPEDLSVILTVALTVGAMRLLRRKGAVRELSAGETLGAATIVCTDKTGTLTQGEMEAQSLYLTSGATIAKGRPAGDAQQALAYIGLALSSSAHRRSKDSTEYVGSATERATLRFVELSGLNQEKLRAEWRELDRISFNERWKYCASLREHPTNPSRMLFATGAPEVLLARSTEKLDENGEPQTLTQDSREALTREIGRLAVDGRLAAVAIRKNLKHTNITQDDVQGLLFLGILQMTDPLRPEAREAVRAAQMAGLKIKIVTGDHEETAKALARTVGLTVPETGLLNGETLQGMTNAELKQAVSRIVVFSRVNPLDKPRIVRALQERGEVVAMTGDGVNDAVALKAADVGVAMGSGKDIAKDAADIVLLDDNFATIIAAIKEGRIIRDNIRKTIAFLLSTNAAELGVFAASLLLRLPLPLLPAQILWINLVTDGTSDMALTMEPAEDGVMARPPEGLKLKINADYAWRHIVFTGLTLTAFAMGLYWYLRQYLGLELDYVRTMVFCAIAVSSILSTWSYRSLDLPLWRRGFAGNAWLMLSAAFSLGLQMLAVYWEPLQPVFQTVPLNPLDWSLIFSIALASLVVIEARKLKRPGKRQARYAV